VIALSYSSEWCWNFCSAIASNFVYGWRNENIIL